jgi:hypothetical protein
LIGLPKEHFPLSFDLMRWSTTQKGAIMVKRKKKTKVQKRERLRRGNSAARGKVRKFARAKAAKRSVAKAKPKPAPVKKSARKVKMPVTPILETVAVEVIEQPAPDVINVTEVEQTEVRKAS